MFRSTLSPLTFEQRSLTLEHLEVVLEILRCVALLQDLSFNKLLFDLALVDLLSCRLLNLLTKLVPVVKRLMLVCVMTSFHLY